MIKRERFVLTITLQQKGLQSKIANRVVQLLNSRGKNYEQILQTIEDIQDYFKNKDYQESSINNILTGPRIYECSLEKIKQLEQTFTNNDYSQAEIEIIEAGYPHVFCHQCEPLDKKLLFYNDIKIKNLILNHPRHLMQGLKLSYARHSFLTNNYSIERVQEHIFLEEKTFVEKYSISNQQLLTTYPIKDKKYLVKK